MSRQIGEVPTTAFGPAEVIFREGDDPKGEAFMVHIGRVEILIMHPASEPPKAPALTA